MGPAVTLHSKMHHQTLLQMLHQLLLCQFCTVQRNDCILNTCGTFDLRICKFHVSDVVNHISYTYYYEHS